jgi:hypothetical protein
VNKSAQLEQTSTTSWMRRGISATRAVVIRQYFRRKEILRFSFQKFLFHGIAPAEMRATEHTRKLLRC